MKQVNTKQFHILGLTLLQLMLVIAVTTGGLTVLLQHFMHI